MHAECLVSYRPPRRVIHEYGYAVTFVDQVLCSMHGEWMMRFCFYCISLFIATNTRVAQNSTNTGSGEGHTAYIYMRANKAPKVPTLPGQTVLSIPGRLSLNEADAEVYCDETFFHASKLAVGPVADLQDYVKGAAYTLFV